jgi:hypothetical protein
VGSRRQLKIKGIVLSAILLVALVASFFPYGQVLAATTYYVAKIGNDSNPGTEAAPWLTIQKAATTMEAGDTVYVKQGTYNEKVAPARSGSAGNRITYKVYPGHTVTIDGTGINTGDTSLFDIYGKSYIYVEGFRIYNSDAKGVRIRDECHYITLKNLILDTAQMSGIHALYSWSYTPNKVTNIVIDGCEVKYTNADGSDEAISLLYVDQFEIKNCVVHDIDGEKEGIDCKVGCSNGSIHNNEVYESELGIYIDAAGYAAHNIDIYANKVHNNNGSGIVLGNESGGTITDLNIYNNLIYNNDSRGFNIENYSYLKTRVRFFNNTVWHNGGEANITISTPSAYLNDIVIANNIIVGTTGALILYDDYPTEVTIDYNLFYASYYDEDNVYGANYIQANPLLVNPPGDFRLQSGSPAIDAGSATFAPSTDYAGVSRPQGAGYDIGAYEYTGDQPYPDWDVNADGKTNVLDMIRIGQHWGETGQIGWIPEDVNHDGSINVLDMIPVGQHWTG